MRARDRQLADAANCAAGLRELGRQLVGIGAQLVAHASELDGHVLDPAELLDQPQPSPAAVATPDEREQRARRNAEMVQAAKDGATYTEVAARFGLSVTRTSEILRAGGAPPPEHRRGVRLVIDYSPYREDYERGATVRQLADLAGVSFGSMYHGLKRAGTKFRPRGRNGSQ